MNAFIVTAILVITAGSVMFLLGKRCRHTWHDIGTSIATGTRMRVQKCTRCGTIRRKEHD